MRQKKAELDAQARFLESEGINNKEVDARIAFYDREMVSRQLFRLGLSWALSLPFLSAVGMSFLTLYPYLK